jgi:hypothetical protein
MWLKQNAVLICVTCPPKAESASEKFVSIRVNSWLIAIKIFIEHTKEVWYNTNNWGRPPKRGCGVPHATDESDSFVHKKVQNDRIIDYFSIFLYVLYLIRNTIYASRNTVQSKLNDYAKQTQFSKSQK